MDGTTRTSPRAADASTRMRPPDASAPDACLNCGEPVSRRFCPECGQRGDRSEPDARASSCAKRSGEFLHWDGKLAATVPRARSRRPGELTREYLAGRRVRYLSPLRLYLTCSVVYFLVGRVEALAPEPRQSSCTGRPTSQIGMVTSPGRHRSVADAPSDRSA